MQNANTFVWIVALGLTILALILFPFLGMIALCAAATLPLWNTKDIQATDDPIR